MSAVANHNSNWTGFADLQDSRVDDYAAREPQRIERVLQQTDRIHAADDKHQVIHRSTAVRGIGLKQVQRCALGFFSLGLQVASASSGDLRSHVSDYMCTVQCYLFFVRYRILLGRFHSDIVRRFQLRAVGIVSDALCDQ